jgi:probable phosphoglycerate mutase
VARPRSVDLNNPFLAEIDGLCELLLVRHGEQRYWHGMTLADGTNPELSDLGNKQADAVGARLAAASVDVVYASPLRRAFDTGAAIARHHGLEPVVDDELREIDLWGKLPQDQPLTDSISTDELKAIYREAQHTLRWDAYVYGEPVEGFRKRVFDAVEQIAKRHVGERVVIACHGGVIGAYLSRLWGATVDQPCHVHHTSITTVRAMDDYRRVLAVNDYAHVLDFQSALDPLNSA